MVYLVALMAGLLAFISFLLNDWVQRHALVAWDDQRWRVVAGGWQGITTFSGVFLLIGLTLGLLLGGLISARVWRMFQARSDQALERMRHQVQQELTQLQQARMTLTQERCQLADQVAAAATTAQQAAWERLTQAHRGQQHAERQVHHLQARLKGAQGKAARLAKQTQLKSPERAKPA